MSSFIDLFLLSKWGGNYCDDMIYRDRRNSFLAWLALRLGRNFKRLIVERLSAATVLARYGAANSRL